jgi:hypothetical protein
LRVGKKDLWDLANAIGKREAVALQELRQKELESTDAEAALGAVDYWDGMTTEKVLEQHVITNSEDLLKLQWVYLLCQQTPEVVARHPLHGLDSAAAFPLIVAMYATKAAPFSATVLAHMITLVDGYPSVLGTCGAKLLRMLLEVCVAQEVEPPVQIRTVFALCLHGGERCLDVMRRNAAILKRRICDEANRSDRSAEGSAGSVPADLLAAVMVFHDMATLAEFCEFCPPAMSLRIGYDLLPRLTRSQWRPKHFSCTIQRLVELVEANLAEASRVVGKAGISFFIKDLSRKRSNTTDIGSRIDAMEGEARQLEQSHTICRWASLSLKLLASLQRDIDEEVRKRKAIRLSQSWHVTAGTAKTSAGKELKLPGIHRSESRPALPPPDKTLSALERAKSFVVKNADLVGQKQLDIERQRGILIAQALNLLSTIRIKPKQRISSNVTSTRSDALPKPESAPKSKRDGPPSPRTPRKSERICSGRKVVQSTVSLPPL